MASNIEQQAAAFKNIAKDVGNDLKGLPNRFDEQAQQAAFGAAGAAVTGVRRIRLAGLIVGAAQSAAFLAKLKAVETNEPVLVTDNELYTPVVWDTLVLKRPAYDDEPAAYIEMVECLLSVNRERIIVKKYLKGKETSHKQFLTRGDCIVSVAGKFVNKGHTLPFEKIKNLDYVLSSEVSLDYDCRFLFECFNIDKLVCEGRPKYYQIEGSENEYGFEFTLVSD